MNIKPLGIDFRKETMNRPCPLRCSRFTEDQIRFGFANIRFYQQLVRAPLPIAFYSSDELSSPQRNSTAKCEPRFAPRATRKSSEYLHSKYNDIHNANTVEEEETVVSLQVHLYYLLLRKEASQEKVTRFQRARVMLKIS